MESFIDAHGYEYDYEDLSNEEGYFYDVCFTLASMPNKAHGLIIMPEAVHVEWYAEKGEDKKFTYMNIVPSKLFPNKERLDKEDLLKLLNLSWELGFEGKVEYLSLKQAKELFEEWKAL